jgi:AcrR family transcriptional regulator
MSRNGALDRRVIRTRDALAGALVALMHDKPFKTITIQEVLERAAVSRTTFYAHYRDKTDLLFSDVEEFFTHMATVLTERGDVSERVAPVRELFDHVGDMYQFLAVLVESGQMDDVMAIARGCFARGIAQRLKDRPDRDAKAHMYAGALIALLNWWLDRGARESPAAMDDAFHAMVHNAR